MTWTRFMDMHSGGGQKLDWPYIYIEASEDEARSVFYARFGRNPDRVTCTCCGEDYGITESPTLEEATAYERGCRYDRDAKRWVEEQDRDYRRLIPLGDYVAHGGDDYGVRFPVKVIRASEIAPKERRTPVPSEGYVWTD